MLLRTCCLFVFVVCVVVGCLWLFVVVFVFVVVVCGLWSESRMQEASLELFKNKD